MLLVVMILTVVTVGLVCDWVYLQIYADAKTEMPNSIVLSSSVAPEINPKVPMYFFAPSMRWKKQ